MKIIAYYLPQFHRIPENDEWWGEGFTEWSNVKKGKPLYPGHYQPKIPAEGYYNLMDRKTMERQAELANQYGIEAMAFYHYWSDGRMLLEKPAENLLKWVEIPMNFMFFWANHDWVKSWDGTKTMLRKQVYGGYEDWNAHIEYMLPFFKDRRYTKIDGKPVVGIYDLDAIPEADEMISVWDKVLKENGFPGIYVIENAIYRDYESKHQNSSAIVLRQPNIAVLKTGNLYFKFRKLPKIQKYVAFAYPGKMSYKKTMQAVLTTTAEFKSPNKKLFYGFFVGWDNTCRHGKRGYIIEGQTPEIFREYLAKIKTLADKNHVDYLFMNAWNEWAEGMYLEPDKKDGLGYLEAIKEVFQKNC